MRSKKEDFINVRNLVFDYDGVLFFENKNLDKKIKASLCSLIDELTRREDKVKVSLHINSQRGMSFFYEKLPEQIKERYKDRINFHFSGCGGAFVFDMYQNEVKIRNSGMTGELIKYLTEVDLLEKILEQNKQKDQKLWRRYEKSFSKSDLQVIQKRSSLYWDPGYCGSKSIYKCTVDLPENKKLVDSLIEDLRSKFKNIKLDITDRYLDIGQGIYNKGTIIRRMWEEGIYSRASILTIGDNPYAADKPMLHALEKKLAEGIFFYGVTNNRSREDRSSDKEKLAETFLEIINRLDRDFRCP